MSDDTTPATPAPAPVSMDNLVGLAKRRGFIFQSSEIYGGFNGFFDYGPLGAELKKNIRDCWWADMVRRRDDVVGIETSIIMHPKVWEASGHVAGFSDPLVDCKVSKQRYRADQLFFSPIIVDGKTYGVSNLLPMLPMGLTDTQAAEVLTYIRSNLKITRRQSALKPSSSNAQNSQAAVHRGQRRQHWLNDELLEFAHMRVLHFSREREMKESEMTLGGR